MSLSSRQVESTERHHWHDVPRNYCTLSASQQRTGFPEIKPLRKMAPSLTPKLMAQLMAHYFSFLESSETVNHKIFPFLQKK
jgi:hypothetical protein